MLFAQSKTEIPSLETSDLCERKSGANLRSVTIPPDHPAHAVRYKVNEFRIRPKWKVVKQHHNINPILQILRIPLSTEVGRT